MHCLIDNVIMMTNCPVPDVLYHRSLKFLIPFVFFRFCESKRRLGYQAECDCVGLPVRARENTLSVEEKRTDRLFLSLKATVIFTIEISIIIHGRCDESVLILSRNAATTRIFFTSKRNSSQVELVG